MDKTEKELAFLRGIYVEPEWTSKFTELFNESVVVDGVSTITYLNAGAGGHAIAISDKLGDDVDVFPVCENAELREIAVSKAESVKCSIDFSTEPPLSPSEMAIADASLVDTADLDLFLERAVESTSGRFAFFVPTAGSFGEVFSYLWEVLLEDGVAEECGAVEDLISGLRTVSQSEEKALELRLNKVESVTKSEVMEFEDGTAFINSPLVKYFLLPAWLSGLSEERREEVSTALARKIDEESGGMTFRFALKATVVWGEKNG